MSVRILEQDGETPVSERVTKEEEVLHKHYRGNNVCVVTLFGKAGNDPDYEGEQYECEYCDFGADYDHICEECGDAFSSGSKLGGHMSKHNDNTEEEE